ncbi:response regulator [Ramlibacter algicola]|uniref:Response regulator n=1 Tax=Ramlibacter algicola TaxID=2795217 RepID=A0A934Q1B8_9BURK|nr:response regulator [Ramlibacter algicola]
MQLPHRRVGGLPPRAYILVADDHADIADNMALLLELDGHSVSIAHDGRAAYELARSAHFDAALLDIGMPHLSGVQVAEALRNAGSGMLLIACTGYGRIADVQAGLRAGFDHYLVKPVEYGDVAALLAGRHGAMEHAPGAPAGV